MARNKHNIQNQQGSSEQQRDISAQQQKIEQKNKLQKICQSVLLIPLRFNQSTRNWECVFCGNYNEKQHKVVHAKDCVTEYAAEYLKQ